MKITPAHDPNDFQVGKRHSLEFTNILDDNGNINDNGGEFKGQPRFQVGQAEQRWAATESLVALVPQIGAGLHLQT